MLRKFKKCDVVEWVSQSHGTYTFKVGTVVAVIPPEGFPQDYLQGIYKARSFGFTRNHESYLIQEVNKSYVSWPLVKNLKPSFHRTFDCTKERMEELNLIMYRERAEEALYACLDKVNSSSNKKALEQVKKYYDYIEKAL